MGRWITANFALEDGTPATGLTPKVTVRDLEDNSVLVDAASMSEVGGGGYKYWFDTYVDDHIYQVECDGDTTGLMSKYTMGWSDEPVSLRDMSDALLGNWEIQAPNLLILYRPDGVTELARFECFDISGAPSYENIAKATRI